MSYYNKRDCFVSLSSLNGEKKAMQALITAEAKTRIINPEARLKNLKTDLMASKKHSSATLLRRKLKGRLVRELHEI
ncbi:hypothetical protein ACMGGS_05965 [Superficieibacter sp. BNK-5]|uniref:hypothetical protein n=1 Tax=Superficieibacter sp. BNK-5 TaxID=3376142 RepID=UPI0039BFCD6B